MPLLRLCGSPQDHIESSHRLCLKRRQGVRGPIDLHGDQFLTVGDYYETVKHLVQIVDLADLVPALMPSDG